MATPVTEAEPTDSPAIRLPPRPRIPKTLQATLSVLCWPKLVARLTRRYGSAFTLQVPTFGTAIVVTDPELARQVFLADPADIGVRVPNVISQVVGPGSVFGLNTAEHRRRRDLLSPVFHGKRLRAYETLFVEETLAEIAHWPQGTEFATHPSLARIATNTILRVVFGATGAELDELRRGIPPLVKLGSRLAVFPQPARTYGRLSPWGRLAQRRARYEAVVDTLIAQLRADPNADNRTDVLATLLRGNTDGTPLTRGEIGDELLGLAGTAESIAGQLCWVFERISRHPQLLAELTAEVDAGGRALRRATIREVLRTRTLGDFIGRSVDAPVFRLGEWVVPRGCVLRVDIGQLHQNPAAYPDPDRFDPRRYLADGPSAFEWIPYGGGTRHCPGSAFANLHMDVTLRTVLEHFTIEPTTAPDEKRHSRGIVNVPKRGGRITVRRRER